MKGLSLLLTAVAALGFAAPTRADESVVRANITFKFAVAGNELPAGHYEVVTTGTSDSGVVELRNLDTGKPTIVEYLTRIAARPGGKSSFVFDKIGNERYLSEIHLTDADGYVLPGVGKRPHTHEEVPGEAHTASR